MNEKKYYLIYQVTNNINGKIYIGKHETDNLEDDYMGSGKILKRAQEKYGLENFTFKVLIYLHNEEEMNLLEHLVVTPEFCQRNDVYNINEGGYGGWTYINKNNLNISGNWKSIYQYRKDIIQKLGYDPYKQPNLNKKAYYSKDLDQIRYFLSSDIIPDGFELGNPHCNTKPTLNMHWYYNIQTKQQKCLTEEEYKQYDSTIWIKGRCPEKQNYVRYNPSIGTKCMYNEQLQKTKHVREKDIQKYLEAGWKFGAVYNWKKFLENNGSPVQVNNV